MEDHLPQSVRVERRAVSERESRLANGPDWDRYADEYQATHGAFLGDAGFVWGPEGHREDDLAILGDVDRPRRPRGRQRRRPVLALGPHPRRPRLRARPLPPPAPALAPARRGDRGGRPVGARHRDRPALRATRRFDVVFCSFGALQFVSDIERALAEVARVLRPGGRFAFSITHPTRWMFPDDPGEAGLTASAVLLGPHPLRRGRRRDRRRVLRRAPPHARRLGAPAARGAASCWPTSSSPSGPSSTTACGAGGHAPAGC